MYKCCEQMTQWRVSQCAYWRVVWEDVSAILLHLCLKGLKELVAK